ncbi:hypothetical protein [Neisseria meningitidis]|uniref:hypothetical protein n=1 Tax=Neisseria meningitidis TaxID=487 RepID=UPI000399E111|nr:hypothetical protein [Neisseria meningitidis]
MNIKVSSGTMIVPTKSIWGPAATAQQLQMWCAARNGPPSRFTGGYEKGGCGY